jgi:uncharacterized protein YheU (UPF0270 family)
MNEPTAELVVIPHTKLSGDALQAVIESFVLREGTDYGGHEFSLQEKVAHVMRQLDRKEAQIIFDPNSESIDIVVSKSLQSRETGGTEL